MQAIYSDTDLAPIPRPYSKHVHSLAFNAHHAERLCDVIYLVDADSRVRKEISSCFAALDMKVIGFSSAAEYLSFAGRDSAACVILDTHLPDLSGLELQRRLAEKSNPPVIFISDQCDIAATVHAMKAGAMEFLTKPLDRKALIAAVRAALAQDRKQRQRRAELAKLQECFSQLTQREREVLSLIVGGLLNKQAASVLGISAVTLQIHRGQAMRKMQAESFAELVRMAMKLRLPYWRESQPHLSERSELWMSGMGTDQGSLA